MPARLAVRLAQAVLVGAAAAPLLLADRARDVAWTIGLHLVATAAYCVLAVAVVRRTYRPTAGEVFLLAGVLAALALALTPQLSDDIHRYVFEGKLVRAGLNPYLSAPDDPATAHLRGPEWPRINHKDVPAAYPPAVQLALGAAVTLSPSPLGPKLVFGLCAFLTFVALWRYLPRLGLPRERAVVFGWCPLVWLECAGEGHSDALTVAATVLALWCSAAARPTLAGACLAVATCGKLLPCVLLPFLARRAPRVWVGFAAGIVLLYVPFLAEPRAMFAGTLEYAARWRANESAYALVHALTEWVLSPWRIGDGYRGWLAGVEVQRAAKLPLVLLGLWLLAHRWRRQESVEQTAFAFFVFFVAFTPTLHPWYVVLLVPWLCLHPRPALLAFTGTVALAYHVLPGFHAHGRWEENVALRVLEYVPFYLGVF